MAARILIIEDNDANLDLMRYLLEAFGYPVSAAGDGESGLALLASDPPELILCDVHLPGIDGYEVARRIKANGAISAIPLVAVTALAMVGDREKVLAAGFDGYLAKPIVPETFVAQLEAYLPSEQRTKKIRPTRGALFEPPEPATARTRATILIVDDDQANLQVLQSVLEPSGYTVLAASGSDDALALARQSRPDLILADLHLGGEAGDDALILAVKADKELREIPFVFISSTTKAEQARQHGLALGAVQFIFRPISPQELLNEIAACLQTNTEG